MPLLNGWVVETGPMNRHGRQVMNCLRRNVADYWRLPRKTTEERQSGNRMNISKVACRNSRVTAPIQTTIMSASEARGSSTSTTHEALHTKKTRSHLRMTDARASSSYL